MSKSKKNPSDYIDPKSVKDEISNQRDRVVIHSSRMVASLMEAANLSVNVMIDQLKDPMKPVEEKMTLINFILEKVLPNTPEGIVKQNFAKLMESYSDLMEDEL